jgi:cytosine/adenosine deaminase-related metal-dependent hydrolase
MNRKSLFPEPHFLEDGLASWMGTKGFPLLRHIQNMGGAYVMFAEDILGSIEVGKLADFVVIPVDHMTIPAEDIW